MARPTVSVDTFRTDAMFPAIERSVAAILATGDVVAPVDVLVRIGWLSQDDLQRWRTGDVPFLERVVRCNLAKLSRFLRILRFHAHDLDLVPSTTAYVRHGGRHRARLRFTRTGDPRLEEAYARHFVWPGKGRTSPRPGQSSPSATDETKAPEP